MQVRPWIRRTVVWGGALLLGSAGVAVLQARQSNGPRPVAANTVAAHPDAYADRPVSLAGIVDAQLSSTVFVVDQDADAHEPGVLVIAPGLEADVPVGAHVTAVGRVSRLDTKRLATVATNYPVDLPEDLQRQYANWPVILASWVFDRRAAPLAKWVPPPLSREDRVFVGTMKDLGVSYAALRKAVEGQDAATARRLAADMEPALENTVRFWRARRDAFAQQLAEEARAAAGGLAAAADREAVEAGSSQLTDRCRTCHEEYREQGPDGTYFIRQPGS